MQPIWEQAAGLHMMSWTAQLEPEGEFFEK